MTTVVKRWNGTRWVGQDVTRWDGSSWTDQTPRILGRVAPPASPKLVPKNGLWWGAYTGGDDASMTAFEQNTAGRRIDVASMYLSTANDGPNSDVIAHLAKGRIPLITVTSKNNRTGDYQPWSAIAAGTYDTYWTAWGNKLAALDAALFFTFEHEAATKINQWKDLPDNEPAQFIAAFRRVHSLIAPVAPRVVWPWWAAGINLAQEDTLYPGDGYCDWILWDPYKYKSHSASETPVQTFSKFNNHLNTAGYGAGKPRGIAETGCDRAVFTSGSQSAANWWLGVPDAAAQLGLKLVTAFDRSGSYGDMHVDVDPPQAAYRTASADPRVNQPHPETT